MNNRAPLEDKLRDQWVEALVNLVNDEIILADAVEAGRQVPQEHLDRYIPWLLGATATGMLLTMILAWRQYRGRA